MSWAKKRARSKGSTFINTKGADENLKSSVTNWNVWSPTAEWKCEKEIGMWKKVFCSST